MGKTTISIHNTLFRINGDLTYSEIPTNRPEAQGLLMNARFIQGVFDDVDDPGRFARWGHAEWDPTAHTQGLIDALPQWYDHGLRAFTVGFQGGGPCFTSTTRRSPTTLSALTEPASTQPMPNVWTG